MHRSDPAGTLEQYVVSDSS